MNSLLSHFPSDSPTRPLRDLADKAREELERRLRGGESCRVEDLLTRYPQLTEHPALVLDLIGQEFVLRQRIGQVPSIDDYCARFPQWRDSLQARLALFSELPTGEFDEARTLLEQRSTDPRTRNGCGRTLGKYDLLERIGHGGMGDVYRARQCPPLERIVALKLLHTGDAFEIRTFEREIEVAQRLRHPNLLPIYDAGCIDGEYYYTMPLLSGGSLEKRLRRQRPEPRWTAALMEKVARAVHFAHRQNVLHRDLKPANILLDEHDEPLIADFGLAKLLDRSQGQTRTGQMLGSVPYMSPEQADGRGRHATPTSDVWALGVILYEMLTGQRPFQGDNHSEILTRIQRVEPFRPRQMEAAVPADLETICLKCLEKDPAWRYPSAAELADALRHWLDGVPLPESSDSLATRLRRVMERRRTPRPAVFVLLAGALLLGLFALLPLSVLPQFAQIAPNATDRDAPPDKDAQPGQPFSLLTRGGRLHWSRIEMGKAYAKLVERQGQPCSLITPTHCLLELCPPNPKRTSYRLTVTMRHTDVVWSVFISDDPRGLLWASLAIPSRQPTSPNPVWAASPI